MNVNISFIIPCYNGANYIETIIKQINDSHLRSFEVIVVNDGSKDDSKYVLDRLENQYTFLSVIHQNNKGASSARNTGYIASKGEYICFLDCDDYVYSDNLSFLENYCDGCDLILFNVNKCTENKYYPYIVQKHAFTNKLALLKNMQFVNAPWGKLIKRSFMENNKLLFNTELKLCEDLLWSVQLMACAITIECVDLNIYIYKTDNATSTTNTINFDKFELMWKTLEASVKWCDDNKCNDACYGIIAYQYMMNCAYCGRQYSHFKQIIKKYSYLLNYDGYKKVRYASWINKAFGLKIMSCFLNRYLTR